MTTVTTSDPRLPAWLPMRALVSRSLRVCSRQSALVIGPLFMSAFFLVIYHGQLASAVAQFVPERSYVAFLMPLVLLTTAFSGGAISGQLILRDFDSGYYSCLALSPSRRGLLAAAPTVAGLLVIAAQAITLLSIGWLLGLRQPHGWTGIAAVIGFTIVAGGGFLLLALAAAFVGRNIATVNMVTWIFFPLSFMTTTFVPLEELHGWMAIAARINPLTYLLEAMRDTLNPGWDGAVLGRGGTAATGILVLGVVAVSFAMRRHAEEVDR